MAANKFATMLHRNTNKITMILIYAVLEWTLICLLLLNSLFSYLIVKFADYFGLKPPCFWCCRAEKKKFLCESHSREVSRLGFCETHCRLVESKAMCGDCSESMEDFHGFSHGFRLLPWMKEVGNGEKCSCCGVGLEGTTFGSPYIVIKSSWDQLIKGAEVEVEADHGEKGENSEEKWSDFEVSRFGNENFDEKEEKEEDLVLENAVLEDNSERVMKDQGIQVDLSLETLPKHLEFFIDCSGNGLVPIELIDSMAEEDQSRHQFEETNLDEKTGEEPKFAVLESMEIEEDENSLVFYAKDCFSETQGFAQFSISDNEVQILGSEEQQDKVSEEYSQMQINETEAEAEADVSIGTEIPDLDIADDLHCSNEDPSTSSTNFIELEDHGCKQDQEQTIELRALSVDLNENAMSLNEPEEEKVPDTPSSVDSLHRLHRKLLLLEKKDSASEESLDGSVIGDLDGLDPVSSIERLKTALKSERKALHALYTELEEERSASAVAANQTMAMINRLQEEKASMQMEALQYQRMMDEQSEYDQEALQLLNELMVKREKERQELEKELEVYRKRVLEFEAKERVAVLKRSKDNGSARSAFSSASCSNGEEDSDGLSIDLNQEAKDESFYAHQESSTPADDVLNLEDSLADFEGERMAILEQLKVLEEKLITMDYEDSKGEINGHSNGYAKEMNGKHQILSSMGKSLLPLFDDALSDDENGDVAPHENGFYSNGVVHDSDITTGDYDDLQNNNKRVAVEEELDCLHERLQALEADREFLKHCISSLKKGDKGMDLLQEILQHLRDLRNVDLRVRNLSDGCLV
ncbi:PREDICTED: myosin-binding protein 2 [Ipomoea nil]|uniref:myosin-binding protein 2 n=1 Tax=Ipomoea nil TaxID=35883 RepID=UPI000901AC6D|nr:PREDICTED: myosin-binding protein 2 [Ipomoea nil]XP_019164938.1 PREDICTED: myosin-binding protein 2 [Ipomoea nil]